MSIRVCKWYSIRPRINPPRDLQVSSLQPIHLAANYLNLVMHHADLIYGTMG